MRMLRALRVEVNLLSAALPEPQRSLSRRRRELQRILLFNHRIPRARYRECVGPRFNGAAAVRSVQFVQENPSIRRRLILANQIRHHRPNFPPRKRILLHRFELKDVHELRFLRQPRRNRLGPEFRRSHAALFRFWTHKSPRKFHPVDQRRPQRRRFVHRILMDVSDGFPGQIKLPGNAEKSIAVGRIVIADDHRPAQHHGRIVRFILLGARQIRILREDRGALAELNFMRLLNLMRHQLRQIRHDNLFALHRIFWNREEEQIHRRDRHQQSQQHRRHGDGDKADSARPARRQFVIRRHAPINHCGGKQRRDRQRIRRHRRQRIPQQQQHLRAVQSILRQRMQQPPEAHDPRQRTGGHEKNLHQILEQIPKEGSAHAEPKC